MVIGGPSGGGRQMQGSDGMNMPLEYTKIKVPQSGESLVGLGGLRRLEGLESGQEILPALGGVADGASAGIEDEPGPENLMGDLKNDLKNDVEYDVLGDDVKDDVEDDVKVVRSFKEGANVKECVLPLRVRNKVWHEAQKAVRIRSPPANVLSLAFARSDAETTRCAFLRNPGHILLGWCMSLAYKKAWARVPRQATPWTAVRAGPHVGLAPGRKDTGGCRQLEDGARRANQGPAARSLGSGTPPASSCRGETSELRRR
ncbi:hypothetical protein HPB47_021713 [Ixodes persulcatus]|uniref:Uncharacterized protein n=1 Tax=Ixodes persulcatus TaxID=34615 RepID=A0AC60QCQ6_IXOPE|nr:hypothetical protein HPB47_021713 [Ixodes persulcatus]